MYPAGRHEHATLAQFVTDADLAMGRVFKTAFLPFQEGSSGWERSLSSISRSGNNVSRDRPMILLSVEDPLALIAPCMTVTLATNYSGGAVKSELSRISRVILLSVDDPLAFDATCPAASFIETASPF